MKMNGKTDIGCNRAENQDTFRSGSARGGSWGVVCDGMGGAQHGKLASAVAAESMEEMLYQQLTETPDTPPRQMLEDAIRLANAEVYTRSGQGQEMMGTTLVCGLAVGGTMHIAHVGDSRAYLYEKGDLKQLTHDHSMVQEMVDNGTITQAEAEHHPEKNVITRAMGVEERVQPSFIKRKITPDSLFLLCSDGLTNMVSPKQMAELIAKTDFWDLARELVDAALAAGGDDNITVLLMQPEEGDVG